MNKLITGTIALLILALTVFPLSATIPDTSVMTEEEKIIASYEAREGFIPNPLLLMAERPGVLPAFMAHGLTLLDEGPLTERERYLVSLSAAVALKSENCIAAHTGKALRAGATEDEILQAILIAGFIGNTSSLQVAWEAAGILDTQQPD